MQYSGPQLKRVVITSSCASVFQSTDRGLLDENNWNEKDVAVSREKGKDTPHFSIYAAARVLAEKGEHVREEE